MGCYAGLCSIGMGRIGVMVEFGIVLCRYSICIGVKDMKTGVSKKMASLPLYSSWGIFLGFPCISLHFLARNAPDNCICDGSSSVSSGLPFGSPLSAGSVDNALGARRRDPKREPRLESSGARKKNPGAFAPGLSVSTDR